MPLELDLRPGWQDYGLRLVAFAMASLGLYLCSLAPLLLVLLQLLIVLLALHDLERLRARPQQLILYDDGELAVGSQSQPLPARLLQAGVYGVWPWLQFEVAGRRHAAILFPSRFPSRFSAQKLHALRVWLATHPAATTAQGPSEPSGVRA